MTKTDTGLVRLAREDAAGQHRAPKKPLTMVTLAWYVAVLALFFGVIGWKIAAGTALMAAVVVMVWHLATTARKVRATK